MTKWNPETGLYQPPPSTWQVEETPIPENAPDVWLSRPGGNHLLGMSFHFAPFTMAEGNGTLEDKFTYSVAPYLLNITQDPYNSWAVSARLREFHDNHPMEHWDWQPGILIIDTSESFSLPDQSLAAFAGTEWADNDHRVYCGLLDLEYYTTFVQKQLELVNHLTGPGWSGWPFGQRQLAQATITWINPATNLPDLILLASSRQFGAKHHYLNQRLFHPGYRLGGWEGKPDSWDCRQALRFLYQAQLMLDDGLPEMALSAAIASLENASAQILEFLVDGDSERVESELKRRRFLDRFDNVLPDYGVQLPQDMFESLRDAYFARNGVIHGLRPVSLEKAKHYIEDITEVMVWYWESVGGGPSVSQAARIDDDIPF